MENRKNYVLKVAVAVLCAFNLYMPSFGNMRPVLSGLRHRFKLSRQKYLPNALNMFDKGMDMGLKGLNMYGSYLVVSTLLLGYGIAKSEVVRFKKEREKVSCEIRTSDQQREGEVPSVKEESCERIISGLNENLKQMQRPF